MTPKPPRFNLTPQMRELAARFRARKPSKVRKAERAAYEAKVLERASDNLRKAGGLLAGDHGKTPPNPPAEFPESPQGSTHDGTERPNP